MNKGMFDMDDADYIAQIREQRHNSKMVVFKWLITLIR